MKTLLLLLLLASCTAADEAETAAHGRSVEFTIAMELLMPLITADQMRAFAPSSNYAAWAPALDASAAKFQISTPLRICKWLGQLAEETGGFVTFAENMDYSAARLVEVWPSFFPTLAAAAPYAHNPQKLASHVYANRYGNGNEASGDGYRYRGEGPDQLTFESAYAAAEKALGRPYVAHPELLLQPADGALTAAWFFAAYKGCLPLADRDDINGITEKLEGSLGNLALRQQWVAKAKGIWQA